jgi:hypothetical protein
MMDAAQRADEAAERQAILNEQGIQIAPSDDEIEMSIAEEEQSGADDEFELDT